MIDIPAIKAIVLKCLPEYWYYGLDDIDVTFYDKEKYINLDCDYIAIRCKYNNLGKVFIGNSSFLARSV